MTDVAASGAERSAPGAWDRRHLGVLAAGLAVATLMRLTLLPTEGMTGDVNLFASWVHRLATDVPLGRAYDLELTFGPVMAYIFWLIGQVDPAFQVPVTTADSAVAVAITLPAALADLAIAGALAWALRDRPRLSIVAAVGVALVPVTWYVSSWWGQFEAIYALFGLLAALLVVRGHWALGGIALGLALGTKPQAIPLIAPFAAYAVARLGPRRALIPAAVAAATLLATWLPFIPNGGPARYLGTIVDLQNGGLAILSLRAWNPWWVLQSLGVGDGLLSDATPILGPLTPRLLGYVSAGLGLVAVFFLVLRNPTPRGLLLGIAASVLVAFCLLTAMHERYSFAAVVFLALLLADRRSAAAWVVLAVAVSVNLIAARPPTGLPGSWIPVGGPVGIAGSLAITAVAAACLLLLLDRGAGSAGRAGAA
jgi:Gpi18-like mannosyltransferase